MLASHVTQFIAATVIAFCLSLSLTVIGFSQPVQSFAGLQTLSPARVSCFIIC